MNLYLISQDVDTGYDTFDSMVVAAPDPETAAKIYPYDYYHWQDDKDQWGWVNNGNYHAAGSYDGWARHWNQVDVKLIGVATEGTTQGVVLASFNAG